jgi:hypothetical protein
MKRRHIPLATKLAAALLALGHIPYEEAKKLSAKEIIARYQFDHWPILHAIDPVDEPWNLRPLLIAEHWEKTRKDVGVVAKVKRLARWRENGARLTLYRVVPSAPRQKRKITARKNPWPPKGSRKINQGRAKCV